MLRSKVFNRNGTVSLVAEGRDAKKFSPFVCLGVSVTVHRAMDNRRRDACVTVGYRNFLDPVDIGHSSEAFVVDDDVV